VEKEVESWDFGAGEKWWIFLSLSLFHFDSSLLFWVFRSLTLQRITSLCIVATYKAPTPIRTPDTTRTRTRGHL